ncbi:flagellar basal body-associated FliL family protein [Acetobacteraceae bacterium ESL0709]|nr:flagellar basal body-associated FliL family protein [Acetobacteraceae bacterium ESL0697]MDF7679043.1 flagellar basal body-associated FliL family protein [Acetobacteraceae bacterium ESL0709]
MSDNASDPKEKEPTEEKPMAAQIQKKKPNKKMLLIIGAALLILLGGIGFFVWKEGYFSGVNGKASQEQQEKIKNLLASHFLLGIPAVTANLDSGNGTTTYVKMAANIEIQGHQDSATLQGVIPQVQDIFQTYLHETRPEELHGSGFYRLKEALLRRLRITLSPLNVTNIYITELLTQ